MSNTGGARARLGPTYTMHVNMVVCSVPLRRPHRAAIGRWDGLSERRYDPPTFNSYPPLRWTIGIEVKRYSSIQANEQNGWAGAAYVRWRTRWQRCAYTVAISGLIDIAGL